MTREKFMLLTVGTRVKVIANPNSHNYPIGSTVELTEVDLENWRAMGIRPGGGEGNWLVAAAIEIADTSRNAQLRRLKEELVKMDAQKELIGKEMEWLKLYRDRLDEAITISLSELGLTSSENKHLRASIYNALKTAGCPTNFPKPQEKVEALNGRWVIPSAGPYPGDDDEVDEAPTEDEESI